jgi:cobalt-zinc-cadmium efflux system outer membrane protein
LALKIISRSSVLLLIASAALAQQSYTWQQIKEKFEAANPTLQAGRIGIDESKANEITAYLRPNPDFSVGADQFALFGVSPYRPFSQVLESASMSYLHERAHKRELRLESAKKGTTIAESQQADLERTLLFNLRSAFVQALQAKAILENAKENLAYWNHELQINNERLKAGDIAQIDYKRQLLTRAQFDVDLETAQVNLRTAKIQLLTLLNDRTPIERFDVTGKFDYTDQIPGQDELRKIALDNRPDLRAAIQSVDKAVTDHKLAIANGSTDPTFSMDAARNPPGLDAYIGFSISIPLRIFDRNQGEKARTELDITKNQRQQAASQAQVFSDVDTAFETVQSTLNLLKPYKTEYLTTAEEVRDTVSFAYKRGGATLLDYLDAEKSYRDVHLAYLTLVGTFLTAGGQLNMAVGREVIE